MKKLLFFVFSLISVGVYAQTQITSAAQLQSMSLDGNYILMNDIDFSSSTFNPIGGQYGKSFTGTFDGNGHTITIRDVSTDYTYRGLFSQIGSEGVVKNLKVKGSLDNAPENGCFVGGIAAWNSGTITNCSSSVYINSSRTSGTNAWICRSGCIAGINNGTINYCFADGGMYGAKNNEGTGGIVGKNANNNAKIENCIYIGSIERYYSDTNGGKYGMICGYTDGYVQYITNCYYLEGTGMTGLGSYSKSSPTADDGHCTALSQFDIRALARTGGVYASTTNDVFKNAILSFSYTIDFKASDGLAIFNSIKGEPANVTFRRDATKDKKCTICLPFNIPIEQANNVGKFYEFIGIKSGTTDVAQMTQVTSDLQANTAYVWEPKYGYSEDPQYTGIQFKNVTIANTLTPVAGSGTFQFIGTYEDKTWTASDPDLGKVYGFAIAGYESSGFTNGQFVILGAGASAAPFRAYLKYVPDASSAPRRTSVTLPNILNIEWISADNVTSISNVNRPTSDNGWFTLDGRKLNGTPTKKGIYVNNGKKVLVK